MAPINDDTTVTIVSGTRRLSINVQPGFNVAQVIALLNKYDAVISGYKIASLPNEIEDRSFVLAVVLADNSGQIHGQWLTEGDAQTLDACCGAAACCRTADSNR